MENLMKEMEHSEALKGVGVVLQGYHAAEKYELVRELISPHLNGMFVTPKDIDDTVKRISFTISEGLNMLFAGKEPAESNGTAGHIVLRHGKHGYRKRREALGSENEVS